MRRSTQRCRPVDESSSRLPVGAVGTQESVFAKEQTEIAGRGLLIAWAPEEREGNCFPSSTSHSSFYADLSWMNTETVLIRPVHLFLLYSLLGRMRDLLLFFFVLHGVIFKNKILEIA